VIGWCADRYGRKFTAQFSMALSWLGWLVVCIAVQKHDILLLILGLFFSGLCESNLSLALVIVSDFTRGDVASRTFRFGRVWLRV
jgi:MFS family permease